MSSNAKLAVWILALVIFFPAPASPVAPGGESRGE